MEGTEYRSTQLVEGNGTFNRAGLENFVKEVKLAERGNAYAVISIMGPQSSGKSTLLNRSFGTNFKEMDSDDGRPKTTKGIWLAKCASIEPCTLVMDLEGSDGRERGEDDTAFERQSALFALAVSDIVLINIWCIEIGREHAASKPLLRTVFQVMLKLFSPQQKTLMFVIRDKTKTPLEKLESILKEDVREIWNSIPKPPNRKETRFNEFFNMEFVALPHYDHQEEEFKKEVASLRQRIVHSIAPGGRAGEWQGLVPGSAFSLSTQDIWNRVKEDKDLDIPAHKVMMAKVRCQEIAKEKLESFVKDEIGEPAYQSALERIGSITLDKFKESFAKALNEGKELYVAARDCFQSAMTQFNEGCEGAIVERANWKIFFDVYFGLLCNICTQTAGVCSSKLTELTAQFQLRTELNALLSEPVKELLIAAEDGTWRKIRELLSDRNESVASIFSAALSASNPDVQTKGKLQADSETYAREVVEYVAKVVAESAQNHMLRRFQDLFCYVDPRSLKPRVWKNKEEIQKTAGMAYSNCLKMLSVLAAIRLNDDADNIYETLSTALMGDNSIESRALDMDTWQKVSKSNTMITPRECKDLWKKFKDVTEQCVTEQVVQKPARKVNWEKVADITLKVGMVALNVVLAVTTGTAISFH